MAKRFTDTNKYKKPFVRGLQGAYKVLWDYVYHDCDHAGIWIVDFEIAQIYVGKDLPVNNQDALKYFNNGQDRVIEICENTKWFLPDFIEFQYGKLNEENRAHKSVIDILSKYSLLSNKGLIRSLQGRKDKDKDKDKIKDKDKEEFPEKFLALWGEYPNTNGSKSQTLKNWKSFKKESGLSDDEIHLACMNSSEKQESEGKVGKYIYQLSNVLGKNYKNDLHDLLKWIPIDNTEPPKGQNEMPEEFK